MAVHVLSSLLVFFVFFLRSLCWSHSNCQHISSPDTVPKVDVKPLPVFRCCTACLMAGLFKVSNSWRMNHELTTCEKPLRLDFKLSRIPTPSVTAVWKAACIDLPLQFYCWYKLQPCQSYTYRKAVCVSILHEPEIPLVSVAVCSEAAWTLMIDGWVFCCNLSCLLHTMWCRVFKAQDRFV